MRRPYTVQYWNYPCDVRGLEWDTAPRSQSARRTQTKADHAHRQERHPDQDRRPGCRRPPGVDFGDPSAYSALGAEYFSLGAGTDIAPLLEGLDGDACQAPHWGYMISGEVVVTYTDGTEETCSGQDLFYWPPGHSVRVVDDAEVILFSPQAEHAR